MSERISKKATCIRRAAATARLKRSMLPDGKRASPELLTSAVSAKYAELVRRIRDLDEIDMMDHGTRFKHFIFTDLRESQFGAKAIAAFLLAGGFNFVMKNVPKQRKYHGEMVDTKMGTTVLSLPSEPDINGSDNFAILQSQPLWHNPMTVELKKSIIGNYNSRPDNIHGEYLRILVLDSKYKEGIDLFDVKYVHILEPPISAADLKQAVGRATRFCGQRGLNFVPGYGWPLQVYIYNTEIPNVDPFRLGDGQKVSAHDLMLHYSGLDLGLINLTKMISVLAINSAVDYALNYDVNNYKVETDLYETSDLDDILVAEVEMHGGGGGANTVVAIRSIDEITPEVLSRCYKRKSALFPFYASKMRRIARERGIRFPRRARRAWFCDFLSSNQDYLDTLLAAPTLEEDRVNEETQINESETNANIIFPTPRPSVASTPTGDIDLHTLAKLPFELFQREIQVRYERFTWAPPEIVDKCTSGPFTAPGTPLEFTNTQNFIRTYLTPSSPFKGLLAWHSVGTGKTCMAIAASGAFESAGYNILWVTRNALMADVYKNIFGAVCSLPIRRKIAAGLQIPTDPAAQKRLLGKGFFGPISYRTFQNALMKQNELGRYLYSRNADPLHKTFLIIDEVHKLYDGDLLASEAADFSKIQNYIFKSYETSGSDSVRPLLMTATPISDKPAVLFDIINTLIDAPSQRLMNFDAFRKKYTDSNGNINNDGKDYFQERVKGLISYLNREYDPTTFAQPVFHTINIGIGGEDDITAMNIASKCTYATNLKDCYKKSKELFMGADVALQSDELGACFSESRSKTRRRKRFPKYKDVVTAARAAPVSSAEVSNGSLSAVNTNISFY